MFASGMLFSQPRTFLLPGTRMVSFFPIRLLRRDGHEGHSRSPPGFTRPWALLEGISRGCQVHLAETRTMIVNGVFQNRLLRAVRNYRDLPE